MIGKDEVLGFRGSRVVLLLFFHSADMRCIRSYSAYMKPGDGVGWGRGKDVERTWRGGIVGGMIGLAWRHF